MVKNHRLRRKRGKMADNLFNKLDILRIFNHANRQEIDCAICLWLGLNKSLTDIEVTSDRLLDSLGGFLKNVLKQKGKGIPAAGIEALVDFLINEIIAQLKGQKEGYYTKKSCNQIIRSAFGVAGDINPF
jgi:hypothetical protein